VTAKPGFRARVLNGDFSLSAKVHDANNAFVVEMLDVTTFADDGVKRFIAGLNTSTFSVEGYVDADVYTDSAAWTANQPFTYGPQGLALASPVTMVDGYRSSFEIGAPVAGVVGFSMAGQTDGPTNFGYSLHDLTAETATANGTGYDQTVVSTTAGGIGHLHVTAFSGLTNIIVTIQDSADNISFATIGTFTTVTGVTSQRLTIAGTVRRYVRASWTVTGTGSCTFSAAFARN
jgi:hypothetical protein